MKKLLLGMAAVAATAGVSAGTASAATYPPVYPPGNATVWVVKEVCTSDTAYPSVPVLHELTVGYQSKYDGLTAEFTQSLGQSTGDVTKSVPLQGTSGTFQITTEGAYAPLPIDVKLTSTAAEVADNDGVVATFTLVGCPIAGVEDTTTTSTTTASTTTTVSDGKKDNLPTTGQAIINVLVGAAGLTIVGGALYAFSKRNPAA